MREQSTLPVAVWSVHVLSFMVTLWRGWKGFTHKLITGQSWLIMAIVYFTAIGPMSLFIKLDRNRRLDREPADPSAESFGLKLDMVKPDVRRAQRPY